MNDIVTFLTSHNYLALALFAIVYMRKLFSAESSFPISIPPAWQPVATGGLAMAYGFVTDEMSHVSLLRAALDALAIGGSVGFADALMTACFSQNAPKWVKALVFVFDDLTGAGGQGGSGAGSASGPKPSASAPTTPSKPPSAIARSAFATMLLAVVLLCTSCIKAGGVSPVVVPPNVPMDLVQAAECVIPLLAEGKDFPTIEAACLPGQEQVLIELLALLSQSNDLAAKNMAASVQASILYQQKRRQGARD